MKPRPIPLLTPFCWWLLTHFVIRPRWLLSVVWRFGFR